MKSTCLFFVVVAVFLLGQQQIQATDMALINKVVKMELSMKSLEKRVNKLEGQEGMMITYKVEIIYFTLVSVGFAENSFWPDNWQILQSARFFIY